MMLCCARYIHRVGRTARAGRSGRSITLVGESGRSVLRAVMKSHEERESGKTSSTDSDHTAPKSAVMRSRQVRVCADATSDTKSASSR